MHNRMFKDYSMNNVDESQIEKDICDYVLVPVLDKVARPSSPKSSSRTILLLKIVPSVH